MQREFLVAIAALVSAACQAQPAASPAEKFVPHGRFPDSIPVDQALSACRLEVEAAQRRSSPITAPGTLGQIPAPLISRPGVETMEMCMETKGYRRAR